MRDTHAIPRHADGGTSGDDAAGWRIACLIALAAFLGMGLAAFLVGILPGDLSVRHGLLIEDDTALRTLARWVNLAGTWRVLLPACLVIFALSRTARRRWWLWAGVFLGSGALEHAFKFLVDRPRPSGFALGLSEWPHDGGGGLRGDRDLSGEPRAPPPRRPAVRPGHRRRDDAARRMGPDRAARPLAHRRPRRPPARHGLRRRRGVVGLHASSTTPR